MSLANCFDRALKMNVLTADEHRALQQRYADMIADGLSNTVARDRMAKVVKAEADHRERAALLTHLAIDRMMKSMSGWRDYRGRMDEAEAFIQMHENFGRDGTFMQDAQGRQDAILRAAMTSMKDAMQEFRRGAFLGDLRRTRNKAVLARMENVVREVMGEDTGDVRAKAIAKAWEVTSEWLRTRFNEAGGGIGKLSGGYLPQSHDRLALIAFKRDAWVKYMMEPGRLDRARMLDKAGNPMTDRELTRALGLAWDRITTDGYYDADVTGHAGKGALYTQHMDHRFIHFASADKWLEYNRRFGSSGGDIFAAMMGHISIMARDIAHMEVMGPNPNRAREFVKQTLKAKAAKQLSNEAVIAEQVATLKDMQGRLTRPDPDYTRLSERLGQIHNEMDKIRRKYAPQLGGKPSKRNKAKLDALTTELETVTRKLMPYWEDPAKVTIEDHAVAAQIGQLLDDMRDPILLVGHKDGDRAMGYVNSKIRRADAMWDVMRGGEVGDPLWAARMQSIRNTLSAGSLGSAVISSLTDPAFGQMTRHRLGMAIKESNFARVGAAVMREMITMGNRDDAIAAGLGLDAGLRVLHRQAGERKAFDHRFWSAYVADRVLTSGMLAPWTQAGKHVFGLDLMRWVAKLTEHEWDKLPESTRRAFEGNGIGQAEWKTLRLVDKNNGMWLRPTEVIAANRDLGERYLQMILRETRFAVPETTVRSSSIMHAQAGTLTGEMIKSGMQFKGFGIAVVMLHLLPIVRGLMSEGSRTSTAGYAAALFITSTFLGMMAIALKDQKDGRDPRRWLDEKTWLDPFHIGEAVLQSGGLGIFGDFLRADQNRLGGGLPATMAGPLLGKIENVLRMGGVGQASRALHGKDTTVGEEGVKMLRSGTVPFSNHWALSAIYQRTMMDNLQRMVDPHAQRAFNRQINQRMKDYGQSYYWPPGSPSPARAPDVSRIWSTR